MFGRMPAYGFFIRHAKGLTLEGIDLGFLKDDLRPAFVLNDVKGIEFRDLKVQHAADVPTFAMTQVEGFTTHQCGPIPDTHLEKVEEKKL